MSEVDVCEEKVEEVENWLVNDLEANELPAGNVCEVAVNEVEANEVEVNEEKVEEVYFPQKVENLPVPAS